MFFTPAVGWSSVAEPVAIFSRTLDTDTSVASNISMRQSCGSLAAGGTRARVRFEAPASGTFFCDNAAIGVRTGTGFATVATPVELLFSAASGFTIANGTQITSDWATLTFADTDTLIVIMDVGAASADRSLVEAGAGAFRLTFDSYNVASDSGFSLNGVRRMVNQIEA
jgi:hypothetical protein